MIRSAVAVVRIAGRSRYALATVTGPNGRAACGPASRRSLRQRRTVAFSTVSRARLRRATHAGPGPARCVTCGNHETGKIGGA